MRLPNNHLFFSAEWGDKTKETRYSDEIVRSATILAEWILPGWTVTLMDDPPEWDTATDEYWAVCDYGDNNRDLRIYLTDDLLAADSDEIVRTLVHEMLHPHFRELRFANGIREQDDPEIWNHHEEIIVETFTHLLMSARNQSRPVVRFG